MEQVLDFVERHGAAVVFLVVFFDQLGLPIPTVPLLLAFGALAGSGRIDTVSSLLLAAVASLCADFLWFQLGRRQGTRVLGFLCRAALEPDTCVSKTHDIFARHGVKSLLVAKFIPGFDTVAPPLAGMLGVGAGRFLLWSSAGALLWLVAFGGLGYLFSDRIEELASAADQLGSTLALAVAGLVVLYLAWKYLDRQRVLRGIRTARITPDDLYQMILSGSEPVILDARSASDLQALPFVIQGAQILTLEDLDAADLEIPREREIIVYCS
jgi:membrane protein DedA with SNARE-associated domain